jgi:SAM-dependent methyltransferase
MKEHFPKGLPAPSLIDLPPELRRYAEHDGILPYLRRIADPVTVEVVDQVFEQYLAPGSKVVEVGSGSGEFWKLVADRFKGDYECLEQLPQYVEIQHRLYPEAQVTQGDIYRMPYRPESIDAVVAMDVLDVLPKLGGAVKSIQKVLKPGGRFIHFHDRRPNLGFSVRQSLPDNIPFPLVEEETRFFDRLQLLPRRAYRDNPRNPMLDAYVRRIRGNPDLLEQIRAGDFPQEADMLSDLAAAHYGEFIVDRPSLREVFTRSVIATLEASGLEIELADNYTGTTIISDATARAVEKRLRLWPAGDQNRLLKDVNGRWRYSGRVDNLKEGEVLLEYSVNAIVSKKPTTSN